MQLDRTHELSPPNGLLAPARGFHLRFRESRRRVAIRMGIRNGNIDGTEESGTFGDGVGWGGFA